MRDHVCMIRLYARSRGCTFVCACRHAHESANGAANTTADGRAHDQAADDKRAVLCADAHTDAHAKHASDCHADRRANKRPIAHSDELTAPLCRCCGKRTVMPGVGSAGLLQQRIVRSVHGGELHEELWAMQ